MIKKREGEKMKKKVKEDARENKKKGKGFNKIKIKNRDA